MSVFKDLLKDVGENIKEYSKTSLNMFVEAAKQEISGLSNYYVLGEKEVSILRNNLPYIQHSVDIVKGLDGNSKYRGQKSFTYYDKQISKKNPVDGKKTVIEKSWFQRGNLLLITGIRRGDMFFPKRYTDTIYQHTLRLIEKVNQDGSLSLKFERERTDE